MLTCSARGLAMSEPLTNCRITGEGHFAHFMHEWKVVGPLTRKPLHKRGVEVVWIEVVDVVSDEKGEFAIVELEVRCGGNAAVSAYRSRAMTSRSWPHC